MTLKEAASIARSQNNNRIPISGYETKHFFVFTAMGYKRDDPISDDQMFVIDKETKQTGRVLSAFLALCLPDADTGWEQFNTYENDEIIKDLEIDEELKKML